MGQQEILGVVGPNGAGKSTLFKILAMIHKRDEGGIALFGENFKDFDCRKHPQDIGIVSQ